jgi:hypothetical protein
MTENSAELEKKRDLARQAVGRAVRGSFHRPNNDRPAVEKQHGASRRESGETKPIQVSDRVESTKQSQPEAGERNEMTPN